MPIHVSVYDNYLTFGKGHDPGQGQSSVCQHNNTVTSNKSLTNVR